MELIELLDILRGGRKCESRVYIIQQYIIIQYINKYLEGSEEVGKLNIKSWKFPLCLGPDVSNCNLELCEEYITEVTAKQALRRVLAEEITLNLDSRSTSILDSLLVLDQKTLIKAKNNFLLHSLQEKGILTELYGRLKKLEPNFDAPNQTIFGTDNLIFITSFDPYTGLPAHIHSQRVLSTDPRLDIIKIDSKYTTGKIENVSQLQSVLSKKKLRDKVSSVQPLENWEDIERELNNIEVSKEYEFLLNSEDGEMTEKELIMKLDDPMIDVTAFQKGINTDEELEEEKGFGLFGGFGEDEIATEVSSKNPNTELGIIPITTPSEDMNITPNNFEFEGKKNTKIIKSKSHLLNLKTPTITTNIQISNTEWATEDHISIQDFDYKIPNPPITFPFQLDPFQKRAILRIENGECVFVGAHTSAGKTVIAEYAIALAMRNLRKAIYTSPIKALSNQKYKDFRDKFDDVGILTGDVSVNSKASCLIVTTEVLQSMLYRGCDLTRDIDWVIFDEVHYVNDAERGFVWEETIILLPDHINIIMLSATVPNYIHFANWVGNTKKKKIWVEVTKTRPVPLTHSIYVNQHTYLLKQGDGPFMTSNAQKALTHATAPTKPPKANAGWKNLDQSTKMEKIKKFKSKITKAIITREFKEKQNDKKTKGITELLEYIKKHEYLPAIVFCFSRDQCEKLAINIEKIDLVTSREKSKIKSFLTQKLERLKEKDRRLPHILEIERILLKGIGLHHAGLLPIMKEIVEQLFSKGRLKVLFATTTFAMGVNMPARTVVFSNLRKFDGKDHVYIENSEYLQMAGRAGRRGTDTQGNVIIYLEPHLCRNIDIEILEGMIQGRGQPLESKFKLTYKMILHMLKSEQIEITQIMRESFAEYETLKDMISMNNLLRQNKASIVKIQSDICGNCGNFDLILQFYEILQKLYSKNARFFQNPQIFPNLKEGRIIQFVNADYFNEFGLILKYIPDHNVEISLKCLMAKEDKTGDIYKFKEKRAPEIFTKMKNYGTVNKTIYYEYINLSSKNIIKIYDFYIQPSWNLNSSSQIEAINKECEIVEKIIQCKKDKKMKELKYSTKMKEIITERLHCLEELREHKCMQCNKLNLHMKQMNERAIYLKKMEEVKKYDSAVSLGNIDEFKGRLEVLKRYGYIDQNNVLQLKGRVACEIQSGDGILLTELLFSNVFQSLSIPESIAIISLLVVQEKRHRDVDVALPITSDERYYEVKDQLLQFAEKLWSLESKSQVPTESSYYDKINFSLVEVCHHWASKADFAEICEFTDIHDGSIVKAINRIEYSLKEMKTAALIMGDALLTMRINELREAIRRDIIFTPSLYIQE